MKISARNQYAGTVSRVVRGPVSTEVTITIGPGIDVVSVISTASADLLALSPGKSATAIIKASSVLVAID